MAPRQTPQTQSGRHTPQPDLTPPPPGSTLEAPWKHPGSTLEAPWKHPGSTPEGPPGRVPKGPIDSRPSARSLFGHSANPEQPAGVPGPLAEVF